MRKTVIIIAALIILVLVFYIGRKSAQLVYNASTKRIELSRYYVEQQRDIVMFGDSHISYGDWAYLLHNCSVANKGVGGITASDLRSKIDEVLGCRPISCFIEIGTNDISYNRAYNDYIKDVSNIISTLHDHNIKVILLSIPYQCINDIALRNNRNSTIHLFNSGLSDLSHRSKVQFVDINRFFPSDDTLHCEYSSDGMHFNQNGYQVIADHILRLN